MIIAFIIIYNFDNKNARGPKTATAQTKITKDKVSVESETKSNTTKPKGNLKPSTTKTIPSVQKKGASANSGNSSKK